MTQPVWASFKELEDPELCKLAERLSSTIAHNRAEYQGAFRRWKTTIGYRCCQLRSTIWSYIYNTLGTQLAQSQQWRRQSCPGMAGFLRFDKVIQIRPCDLVVQEDYLMLHLPFSKTDQWRKGDKVYISRTGKPTCPVGMLEAHMRRTATSCTEERFLFRPICRSNNGKSLQEPGSISDSRLRDLFKKKWVITIKILVFIASKLVAQPKLPMLGYQTTCLRGMANESWKMLKTALWKTP